jgi:uncharacterized membrane protein
MNNDAHLHLVLSHFPIVLPILGLILFAVGLVFKSLLVKRIGLISMIFLGVLSFLMMQSGEGAEEIVEEFGRSHDQIHEHEEHAETLALINYLIAGISCFGLWVSFSMKKYLNILVGVMILLCVASTLLTLETAEEGGRITHDEAFSEEANS